MVVELELRELQKKLGEMIRSKRKALQWTQEHLASKARISTQYLSRIETGAQPPSMFALNKIAKAFGSELIIDISLKRKTERQKAIDKLTSILKKKSASDIQALTAAIKALEPYGKNSD